MSAALQRISDETVTLLRSGKPSRSEAEEAVRTLIRWAGDDPLREGLEATPARAILRDEAEAEDVVQEVYVRAFSKLAGFRGDAAILTWLTRITLNEARERLRQRRPTVEVADLDGGERESAQVILLPTATPEAEAARGEIRRILEQAVDDLPEVFRVVFILREVEDCSVEETAENLGLNPSTVKTRLHRARRLLRKALDEKLSSAVTEAFPFLGARCQRIGDRVMERLGLS